MAGKSIFSIFIMIIVAPLVAIITLAIANPAEFGGQPDAKSIFFMYAFAMITVPLWVTYAPSIILIPIVMNSIHRKASFQKAQIFHLVLLSAIVGALLGILILSPIIILTLNESTQIIFGWVLAGGNSGAVSLISIVLIYRFGNSASTKDVGL